MISYGSYLRDEYRRAASYVEGEKLADLPVQAPTKYDLMVNLKTAEALGLEVPPTILVRAGEVIEWREFIRVPGGVESISAGSPRAWHGTDDLSSAFLTAVGYVIDLAPRNKDADFHECFASEALRRMGLKARLGFL